VHPAAFRHGFVQRVITDVVGYLHHHDGLVLRELAPGVIEAEVHSKTAAHLVVRVGMTAVIEPRGLWFEEFAGVFADRLFTERVFGIGLQVFSVVYAGLGLSRPDRLPRALRRLSSTPPGSGSGWLRTARRTPG
jgi:hypothetical protein